MGDIEFYKELEEIRRQIIEVVNPMAREVLTEHTPETRSVDYFKGVIASTIVEVTKLESRIIEIERKYLERQRDNLLEKTRTNVELERMTESAEDWQERVDNFTMK